MTRRLLSLALAAAVLSSGGAIQAAPAPAPAAVRSATITFREADAEKPRDQVALNMMLAIEALSADFDPAVEPVEIWIGEQRCVAVEPGDGARWSRVRHRPWKWRAKTNATPGCPGKATLKLDLRNGKLTLKLRKSDARPAMRGGAAHVPVRVLIGEQEFRAVIDFSMFTKRWKHRNPGARPPRDTPSIPDLPGDGEPDPYADRVGHSVLLEGSRYRGDGHPGFAGVARTQAAWTHLWGRDWAPFFGFTVPAVDFTSRRVVTFAGAVGSSIESIWFEQKGDNLVGHVLVNPLEVNGGYVPSYRVFGAYTVPHFLGLVSFEVVYTDSPKVWFVQGTVWDTNW